MKINPERLWWGVALPLAKLAELDDCPSPIALADAVGDRYLCAHNPVFRAVRKAVLSFGYSFSSDDSPLWRDYLALTLTTLHQIIRTKTIPYHCTGKTLSRLLESNSRVSLSPGFILSCLKSNFVLHESAHCVAHSVLEDFREELGGLGLKNGECFVLQAAIEESFANTAERLGTVCTYLPLADEIFYPLNSNITQATAFSRTLNSAAEQLGERRRFGLLFFSSIQANLAGGSPDDQVCANLSEAAGCGGFDSKIVKAVIDTGFSLNHTFREYTNPLYFEFLGFGGDYLRAAKSDWLTNTANHACLNQLADRLFELVSAEGESGAARAAASQS